MNTRHGVSLVKSNSYGLYFSFELLNLFCTGKRFDVNPRMAIVAFRTKAPQRSLWSTLFRTLTLLVFCQAMVSLPTSATRSKEKRSRTAHSSAGTAATLAAQSAHLRKKSVTIAQIT